MSTSYLSFLATLTVFTVSDINHYVRNGRIYTSHEESLPPIFSYSEDVDWTPISAMRLCRGVKKFPHIAFVPKNPRFEGLIGRLQDIELVWHNGKCGLSLHLLDSWQTLEEGLKRAAQLLLALCPMLPLYFEHFPYPTSFGYARTHSNEQVAYRCA